jgi:hypothetical protein
MSKYTASVRVYPDGHAAVRVWENHLRGRSLLFHEESDDMTEAEAVAIARKYREPLVFRDPC